MQCNGVQCRMLCMTYVVVEVTSGGVCVWCGNRSKNEGCNLIKVS